MSKHACMEHDNARPDASTHTVDAGADARIASNSGQPGESQLAAAVDRRDFALNLPLVVPFCQTDVNGIHRGVGWLQAHPIGFLVEALEGCGAAAPCREMRCHDDIPILDI